MNTGARPRMNYPPEPEPKVQVRIGGGDVRLDPHEANALFGEIRQRLGGVTSKPSKAAIVLDALRCYCESLRRRP